MAAQVHRRSPGRRQDLLTSFVVVLLGQRAPVRVLWGTVGGAASSCRPISREVLGAEIMVTLHRINRFLVIIHLHFMFSHAQTPCALCPWSPRPRRSLSLPLVVACAPLEAHSGLDIDIHTDSPPIHMRSEDIDFRSFHHKPHPTPRFAHKPTVTPKCEVTPRFAHKPCGRQICL